LSNCCMVYLAGPLQKLNKSFVAHTGDPRSIQEALC
jgi:hypothetical protein